MPQNLTNEKSILVQVMAWCRQAASHCLSQCWPRSMSLYGNTKWVSLQKVHKYKIEASCKIRVVHPWHENHNDDQLQILYLSPVFFIQCSHQLSITHHRYCTLTETRLWNLILWNIPSRYELVIWGRPCSDGILDSTDSYPQEVVQTDRSWKWICCS